MERVKKELLDAIKSLEFKNVILLNRDEYKCEFTKILTAFFDIKKEIPFHLWPFLKDRFSIYEPEAWRWGKEFLAHKKCYLMVEDEKTIFVFENGEQIIEVIGQSFGFIYYIVDYNLEFLICFNDCDYLVVLGTAIDWLKSYLINR